MVASTRETEEELKLKDELGSQNADKLADVFLTNGSLLDDLCDLTQLEMLEQEGVIFQR